MSIILKNAKILYKKSLVIEFFCLVFFILMFSFFYKEQAESCLLGVLAAFLPQVVFASYFLHFQQNQAVQNKAKLLYKSECLKIGLAVCLFVLVFLLFDVKPLGLFVGYFLTITLNSLLPIVLTVLNKSTS